jgi:hypothetical protein
MFNFGIYITMAYLPIPGITMKNKLTNKFELPLQAEITELDLDQVGEVGGGVGVNNERNTQNNNSERNGSGTKFTEQ